MSDTREKPEQHGIREFIIEPSKLVWAPLALVSFVAISAIGWLTFLHGPDEILVSFIVLLVFLFTGSFLLPLCHSIRLDAYGISFNRFFKSRFHSWRQIHSAKAIIGDDSSFPSHVAIFFSEPTSDYFFGQRNLGDINIWGFYALNKWELADAINLYLRKNAESNLPYTLTGSEINFFKDEQAHWGRSGDGKGDAIPKLTLWQRIYRWRNK